MVLGQDLDILRYSAVVSVDFRESWTRHQVGKGHSLLLPSPAPMNTLVEIADFPTGH